MSVLHNTLSSSDNYITTQDNHPVKLTISIFSQEELEKIDFNSPEIHGIGLLDTDFFYRGRDELPGEEEQYRFFKDIASMIPNKPIVIRTCSLCSRQMPEVTSPEWEINQDLALKGLRLGLENKDILKTQLRAILKANFNRQLRIVLPMVSTPQEISKFKEILNETEEELKEQRADYHPVKQVGIMADVPSAIINAAQLSFYVSFFQVNNNLKNYTMGSDFSSNGLNYLKHDFEPAFLNQILTLAQTATPRHKTVGVSSPLASLPEAVPILLATGVQEFILSPENIGKVKKVIEKITINKARPIASKAISYWTGREAQEYVVKQIEKFLT